MKTMMIEIMMIQILIFIPKELMFLVIHFGLLQKREVFPYVLQMELSNI